MIRTLIVLTSMTTFAAVPVMASTPGSYATHDRQSSAACRAASGLRNASVGPVMRFSDRFVIDARLVTGRYPQPHMKGATGTMLCLYHRRTQRAEIQEMTDNKPIPL